MIPQPHALLIPSLLLLFVLPLRAQELEAPAELDTRGVVLHEAGAFEGFTLIAQLTGKSVFLVDMSGEVAHQWDLPTTTESAILLANGNLLRWGISTPTGLEDAFGDNDKRFRGPGVAGGLIEEVDWEGKSIWRYLLDNDTHLLHHDIAQLPNGNLLFLAWEYRSEQDCLDRGRDPAQVDERGMWPDAVYEIRPTPGAAEGAQVVWEWHVWDHLIQDFDATKANFGSVADAAGKLDINVDHRGRAPLTEQEIEAKSRLEDEMAALGYGGGDEDEEQEAEEVAALAGTAPDWLHTNAIDYLPAHDLILLSSPHLNELLVIDHSTSTAQAAGGQGGRFGRGGDILWRWGNPKNYGAGLAGDQQLSYQHDPTWLPSDRPGELRLLVFNNGRVRHGTESFSSADELVIGFDPEHGFQRQAGAPFGPAKPIWSYSEPGTLFSSFISGAQRLPNGNTLICSGVQGRVLEVTRAGKLVWDFRNPHVAKAFGPVAANSLYRARRIARDHPGLKGRKL